MKIEKRNGLKAALIPVIAVFLLAMLPQIGFWMATDTEWKGSYFVSNYDEPAYSAYVNSLMRGEPRKNDPFLGLADTPGSPQPETLYSVQFVPAMAISAPARALGLTSSAAFILLAAAIAIGSALAINRLLIESTGDVLVSTVGPIIVLCLGTAVAFQGELRDLVEGRVLADFLPFLRRYQPGFAFPLFFVFCLLVFKAFYSAEPRRRVVFGGIAGSLFAVLVFSYFYLWTAAAAWLVCLAVAAVLAGSIPLRQAIVPLSVTGIFAVAALVPYFYLLSQRSADLDSVQLLSFTRLPDLGSTSMWLGVAVAAAGVYMFREREHLRRTLALVLAFGVTPVLLFNQQIVTGRSLQPVHYELFIANYLSLMAAVLLISGIRATGPAEGSAPLRFQKGLVYLGIFAFAWGSFEIYGSTSRNFTLAIIRDASVAPISAAVQDEGHAPIILATNFVTADLVPSIGDARPYWNPHISSAGGIGIEENRRRFYMFLYFSGYTPKDLEDALAANSFEVTAAVFGSERALPALAGGSNAIRADEARGEVSRFANLTGSLDPQNAYSPAIDHVIVPTEAQPDLSNLDRWYTRDEGRNFGLFTLYRVKPKAALP